MEAAQSRLTWAISQSRTLGNRAVDRFMKLGFYGKAAFVAWVALHFIVLFAVWIITPATLFECECPRSSYICYFGQGEADNLDGRQGSRWARTS